MREKEMRAYEGMMKIN